MGVLGMMDDISIITKLGMHRKRIKIMESHDIILKEVTID